MSESWIRLSERTLEQIRRFLERKDMDRLELVQSMRFILLALHRSLMGWMNWINNPDIMVAFSKEELAEMNRKLGEFVQDFIKYDIEITKQGARKSGATIEARARAEERARKRRTEETFYI
ncbi:DUF2153 family protein [Candidatus Bathyarchaeota archaeon]|nr:DUF2153 family protein [Candidatus Bathyarchaeota archaeon]